MFFMPSLLFLLKILIRFISGNRELENVWIDIEITNNALFASIYTLYLHKRNILKKEILFDELLQISSSS